MEEDKKPVQPENAAEAPALEEQAEQKQSFQELIRGKYREDYLRQVEGLLQAQAEQTNRYLAYRELMHRAELAREKHPGFELEKELEDPTFARLIENGVDPGTAFEVVHKDDRAGTAAEAAPRPRENGLGRTDAPAVFRADPRLLTREERRQLRRRAARGEEIVW